jgi:uncharacterized membrane protein YsdA (DUF1294 family)
MSPFSLLLYWVGLVSLVALIVMGVDKLLAMGKFRRVSERSIWLLALLGGFPGVFLGGFLFHHKTSKPSFWVPVGLSAALWVAAVAYLLRPGIF